MAVLLVVVSLGRDQYLNALASSVPRVAAGNVFDAMTAFPLGTTRVVLLIALLVALGAIAVGNDRLRSWARSVNKPRWFADSAAHRWTRAHRRSVQWVTLALGFVVLVIWDNPTTRIVIVTVVIDLAVVALIGALGGRRAVLVVAPGGPGGGSSSDAPASAPINRPGPSADVGDRPETESGTDGAAGRAETGTGTKEP
jgi:hypothetical protein